MLKGSTVNPINVYDPSKRVTKELLSMKKAAMMPAEAICLNDQIIGIGDKAKIDNALMMQLEAHHNSQASAFAINQKASRKQQS